MGFRVRVMLRVRISDLLAYITYFVVAVIIGFVERATNLAATGTLVVGIECWLPASLAISRVHRTWLSPRMCKKNGETVAFCVPVEFCRKKYTNLFSDHSCKIYHGIPNELSTTSLNIEKRQL